MAEKAWRLMYNGLETEKRAYGQESLLTLGNGYVGWRGASVFQSFDEHNYPGLYVAGVFNQTRTEVANKDVVNEDMVNLPNPQLFKLTLDDQPVVINHDTITHREAGVDFQNGLFTEELTVAVPQGQLTLRTVKAVDPKQYHMLGIQLAITADFSAQLQVESIIDGTLLNQNVARYRAFDSREFNVTEIAGDILTAKTRSTDIDIVVGAETTSDVMTFQNVEGPADMQVSTGEVTLQTNQTVQIDKLIAIGTSYELSEPLVFVQAALATHSVDKVIESSTAYWQEVWETADIQLDSDDPDMQLMIRMNIFHIRQAAQHEANKDLDASVGSRGLTGEGYRGHIFWDEIFVVPYYAANDPETARDILRYRIKRIDAAKKNAILDGEAGAMFPWQSGMYGDEQSQFIHLNTVNNEWEPDNSRLQRHVSLTIAYNIWVYTQITGDTSLLREGGLELLLETTKFWLNKAEEDADGRYHIAGVMGPDEYHEAYPGTEAGGIKDNAYTNLMLTWSLNWLLELAETQTEMFESVAHETDFGSDWLNLAKNVSKGLALEISPEGIIAQYAGYFDLEAVDFAAYEAKYGDIHRIDRLLKAEGLSPDDYQVAKQADTLMTIYNLGNRHMAKLVAQLGYDLPENWLALNKDYYLARTVHGSTTSRPVFAGIDVTLNNMDEALDYLTTAIGSDYYDIQGGTTAEGVHIGVMGETLEVIQNEFGGVMLRDGLVSIAPNLPTSWHRLAFTQKYRGTMLTFEMTPDAVTVMADAPLDVEVYGQPVSLAANTAQTFTKG